MGPRQDRPPVPFVVRINREMQGPKQTNEEPIIRGELEDHSIPRLPDRWRWSGINDPR